MDEKILTELREIKELLQTIASSLEPMEIDIDPKILREAIHDSVLTIQEI